jgi:hypothetical protein
MKGTAIALLIVSAYWLSHGMELLSKDTLTGAGVISLALVLLPIAKYLWSKEIGGKNPYK